MYIPVTVTVWLRLLVSESRWSVVKLATSCSSLATPPPRLSWSSELPRPPPPDPAPPPHASEVKVKSTKKCLTIIYFTGLTCLQGLQIEENHRHTGLNLKLGFPLKVYVKVNSSYSNMMGWDLLSLTTPTKARIIYLYPQEQLTIHHFFSF